MPGSTVLHKASSCGLDHPWGRSPCSLPWVSRVVPPTATLCSLRQLASVGERLLAAAWLYCSTGRRDEASRGGAAQATERCEQAVVRHVAGEGKLGAMVSSAAFLMCVLAHCNEFARWACYCCLSACLLLLALLVMCLVIQLCI